MFDYDRFIDWLEALDKRNLLGKAYILPGLIPLKTARAAHFMAEEVPGVYVPPELLRRMDAAGDKASEEATGIEIALEMIERFKQTPGINGMHVMAVNWEKVVPQLVEAAGLLQPTAETAPINNAELIKEPAK